MLKMVGLRLTSGFPQTFYQDSFRWVSCQVDLRLVSGRSQVALRLVSVWSQVALRMVSGQVLRLVSG
jgi:hypothetical protein